MSAWGKHCSYLSSLWPLSLKRDYQPLNNTAENNMAYSKNKKQHQKNVRRELAKAEPKHFTLCSLLGPTSVRSADNTGQLQTKGIPGIPLLTDLEKTRLIKYFSPRSLRWGQTITGRIKFTRSYHSEFFIISTTLLRGHVSHMAALVQGQIKPRPQ